MIPVFRLLKSKWASQAFDGEGAKRYGGRWNSKGRACVYCAGSESLALLEVLAHMNDPTAARHYSLFELALPEEDVLYASSAGLPHNWREEPAPFDTSEFGDQWLASRQSLALAVPSVIVPREWNYLLNLDHPRYLQVIGTAKALAFEVDARLVR